MKKSAKDNNFINFKQVKLHPVTYKLMAKGHPWVLQDKFTDQFPAKQQLLYASFNSKKYTLIHDSKHNDIKARLWDRNHISEEVFLESFQERLRLAFHKRSHITNRDNFYLLFGEADLVPGFFIQWLKEGILIQSYTSFWKRKQKEIVPLIRTMLEERNLKWVLWQDRDHVRINNFKPLWGKVPDNLVIKEFDVSYLLNFSQAYDIGIYTDMSAIRENYMSKLADKKVLNLYSYTGAWSLFALAKKAKQVTSIDLSESYLEWLEKNLEINEMSNHESKCVDTISGLKQLIQEKRKFDLIICDPPSFSSDGDKTTSAIKAYKNIIPLCEQLMEDNGRVLCFLNTHKITRDKYKQHMQTYLKQSSFKIARELGLRDDCPRLPNFPEGDYLKGLELIKSKETL